MQDYKSTKIRQQENINLAAVFAILRGFLYLDKEIYANAGKTSIRGAQKPTRANKKVLTGEE